MGEVYRARDTKLGRAVALKVLPDAFVTDPERTARFEREAKVLASLNHPHIAALYGMEQSGGRHFLVMELVEGETLAERLARGALGVDATLAIAGQIAEALEAAHERGIVHRDLKPANVKITPDDQVKVLDFGLAKALGPPEGQATGEGPAGLTHSPTLSVMATQAGLILGTAAYMSPEQAKGLQADARSDVFSFGVVLYEMLTGRQPFQGDTAPEVLASVLIRDADLAPLPADLNPRLREVLRRCLEKSPRKRWQAVGDLRAELETIASQPRDMSTMAGVVVHRQPRGRLALAAALGALVAGAATGGAMWMLRSTPASPVVTRFQVPLGEGQRFTNTGRHAVAISPDGTKIVYVADTRLYLRSMGDLEARPIPGTESVGQVADPVFSPDGLSIAFFSTADNTLKRIGVNGGVALTICPATVPFGMSWGEDGIVYGQDSGGILRVSANGGKPEVLVPLFAATKGSTRSLWILTVRDKKVELFSDMVSTESIDATFSPDGRWVAYDSTEAGVSHVYVEPFPRSPGTRYQVTKDQARNSFWSPTGRELFCAPTPTEFAVVAVTTQPSFAFGNPAVALRGGLAGPGPSARRNYDPHPDGKRVLGVIPAAQGQSGTSAPVIHVVVNWHEELKRLVPTK